MREIMYFAAVLLLGLAILDTVCETFWADRCNFGIPVDQTIEGKAGIK